MSNGTGRNSRFLRIDMSDLISKSVLIDDIRMIETDHPFDDKEDIIETVLATIDFQPTVDAVPVVRGEWIRQDDTFTKYMCSNCGSKNYQGYENFCPNCGADMRGKKNE